MVIPQVQEIDVVTGATSIRDYTDAEIAQAKEAVLNEEILKQAKADAINKKMAAEAKLTALGLTIDDLRALGL